jgi:hypothetical protein
MNLVVKPSYFDCWHCIVSFGRGKNYEKVLEISKWCRENLELGNWGREDLHTKTSFILYSEKDVMLFTLRWS